MSRDDLLKVNADIVSSVTQQVVAQESPDTILIVVSNPLDVMTYVAYMESGFPSARVMGMAGVLDTARYRAFLKMELGVSIRDIDAMLLGGHGDTMTPLPRFTFVGTQPVTDLIPEARLDEIIERTKKGGGELVGLMGTSAWYAPGAGAAEMVEAIVKDSNRVLPAAAWVTGEYGLNEMFHRRPGPPGQGRRKGDRGPEAQRRGVGDDAEVRRGRAGGPGRVPEDQGRRVAQPPPGAAAADGRRRSTPSSGAVSVSSAGRRGPSAPRARPVARTTYTPGAHAEASMGTRCTPAGIGASERKTRRPSASNASTRTVCASPSVSAERRACRPVGLGAAASPSASAAGARVSPATGRCPYSTPRTDANSKRYSPVSPNRSGSSGPMPAANGGGGGSAIVLTAFSCGHGVVDPADADRPLPRVEVAGRRLAAARHLGPEVGAEVAEEDRLGAVLAYDEVCRLRVEAEQALGCGDPRRGRGAEVVGVGRLDAVRRRRRRSPRGRCAGESSR